MTLSIPRTTSKVNILPKGIGSLARGLPPVEPGTLFALGANGGMSVSPDAAFRLVFGRNDPDVHVCVGADDPRVSRQHGHITREGPHWFLDNLGRLPIRFPDSRMVYSGQRQPLPDGYTPLFIVGQRREHLLEVRVAPKWPPNSAASPDAETIVADVWELSDLEKLVLVCLGQRYLRQLPLPQPLTWKQVANDLAVVRPYESWGERRIANIVFKVRQRLSPDVPGLMEEEIPPPVGNTLNHNLITALLVSTTLVPADLTLLDAPTS